MQGDICTLTWTAGPASVVGYNVYRMAPPDFRVIRVSTAQTSTLFTDFLDKPHFYMVTALDSQGKESAFSNPVWVVFLNMPTSLVIEKDGNILAQDEASYDNFPEISSSGRWLRTQPVTEYSAYGTQFFTLNPDGWLVISQPRAGSDVYKSLLLYNPSTEGSALISGLGAGRLQTPTGVAWWGNQGYSVAGPYTVDTETMLLAHFDGSFNGAQGETGTPTGASFAAGRYGQAAVFEGSDLLTYPSPGNVAANQGSIEFWIQPTWNGNDNQNHTFIEVNETWENRIKITKDGANNMRFLMWDPAGKEYGVACYAGGWKAGEWHHLAAAWQENWMTLAIDGAQCQSTTLGGLPLFLDETIYVGNSNALDQPAGGLMDELRISYLPRYGNTGQIRILVADSGFGANRVVALDGLGNLVATFGTTGSGNGQFNDPRGLALDEQGNLVVTDRGNNRLQVLSFDGNTFTFMRSIEGGFNAPNQAVPYRGWFVVADTGNQAVKVLDPSGVLKATYTQPDAAMLIETDFYSPRGVAVDRWGRIWVADTGNSRVVRIDQNPLPRNVIFLPLTRR
jgi:hypothetical protein